VSPRLRVWLIVGAAAVAAAGLTVGVTLATRTTPKAPLALRPGAPPLIFDLGLRTDREAQALRRAEVLYDRGQRRAAGRIFELHHSLEAQLGVALAQWPADRDGVLRLAAEHPGSALLRLHEGLVRYWQREDAAADAAWRRAKTLAPDSLYAVRAGDLLHADLPVPGLPQFVPSFAGPPEVAKLSPPRQFAFLRDRARRGGVRDKLLFGVALQRLSRPVSAEREFAAAAAIAPRDSEALTAAAVGRFDKDDPSRTFSRLGPLAREFPHSQSVRFHLGLCLLWLGQVENAKRELRLAVADGASTRLGRQAQEFLDRLGSVGG
jgi:hypothetical protein